MTLTSMLFLLALAGPAAGFDPVQQDGAQVAPDPLAELRAEFEIATKDAGKKGFDVKALEAKRAELALRAKALMKGDPRGELAVRVRIWMATSGVEAGMADRYLDELLTEDIASPWLEELVDVLRPNSGPNARARIETLAQEAGDRTVRGRAIRMLADHVKYDLDGLRAVESGDVSSETHTKRHGAERAEALRKMGSAEVEKQYVALLERVAKDYADVKDTRGRAIGPRAEGALFELRNLAIGKTAPDIEAEDIDGTSFKLSDYRGKVVVIDFWGHW